MPATAAVQARLLLGSAVWFLTAFTRLRHSAARYSVSGPCNGFYCLGHSKNVYDDDNDDEDSQPVDGWMDT